MNKIFVISFIVLVLFSCKKNNQNLEENNQHYEAVDIVKLFIESLSKKDFQTAYNLQKNNNWTSFEEFIKAFGDKNVIKINQIKQLSDKNGKTVICVDANYFDSLNAKYRFNGNFYLKKISKKWNLTDFKIISTKSLLKKDFKTFQLLFDTIYLPFNGSNRDYTSKVIPHDLKKEFIYKYDEQLKNDSSTLTTVGKFCIQNKYLAFIFRKTQPDNASVWQYLFIYDLDANFKAKHLIAQKLIQAGKSITTTYFIDGNFNIVLKTKITYLEGEQSRTKKLIELYSIKNGIFEVVTYLEN